MKKILSFLVICFIFTSARTFGDSTEIIIVSPDYPIKFYDTNLSTQEKATIVKILNIVEPLFHKDSGIVSEYEWNTNSSLFGTLRWKVMKLILDKLNEEPLDHKVLKELYFQIAYKKKRKEENVDLEYSDYTSTDYNTQGYHGTIIVEGYPILPNKMFVKEEDAWGNRLIETEDAYVKLKSYFFITQGNNSETLSKHMDLRYNIDFISDILDPRYKTSIGLSCLSSYNNLDIEKIVSATKDNPIKLKISMSFQKERKTSTKRYVPINDFYTYYHSINNCDKYKFDNIEIVN